MNKDKILAYLYKAYSEDNSRFLLHAGAVAWILGCISQVTGLVFDKKISKESKKFLIPQEIADGVVNVGLFYIITDGFTKLANKLIDKGKIHIDGFNEIKKFIPKGKNMQALFSNVPKELNTEILENFKRTRTGIAVAAGLAGSIISSNILTPIIRNHVSSPGGLLNKSKEPDKGVPAPSKPANYKSYTPAQYAGVKPAADRMKV